MTLQEAISARHSVRAYREMPLETGVARRLREEIEAVNSDGGLHVQLIQDEPKAFQGTLAKYGKFRGVGNYLVMAGRKAADLDERIGYFGEHLVLLAQTLGLNTCWVGLSYTKVPGTYVLEKGEVIRAYIALGYGETQGVGHKVKAVQDVSTAGEDAPSWFRRGVESALLAPTAVNQQKFHFEYIPAAEGRLPRVACRRTFSFVGFTRMDLGIAKYHFEVGAGKDNFEWDDNK